MSDLRRLSVVDFALALAILVAAGGVRAWYLVAHVQGGTGDGPLVLVQDPSPTLADLPPGTTLRGRERPTELDALVHNLKEHRWFGSLAPLAETEEQTAHVAPGYPWLLALAERWLGDQTDRAVRWAQAVLGALTALFYFLFARRAFSSRIVAGLAGMLCAFHPFWVVNTGQVADGVLTTFLLGAAVWLGVEAADEGGPFASLLFGLALAGLALVRAALLPFAGIALLWFLFRSRELRRGWLCGLLAFLGFVNGLAAWTVRNYQVFHDVIPIVDSTWWHLGMGNNPEANGGPLPESQLRAQVAEVAAVTTAANQPARYTALGRVVLRNVQTQPEATVERRLRAGLCFVFGRQWLSNGPIAGLLLPEASDETRVLAPAMTIPLLGTLLGMLLLAPLGWRWSYGWRRQATPAALALVWVPLPYLLSYAEALHGPRLPLDGILLCYFAFALVCLAPTTAAGVLFRGATGRE
jgi:4-amino-4-deoxy-L-arabinose transferase-like glycosyltransferase